MSSASPAPSTTTPDIANIAIGLIIVVTAFASMIALPIVWVRGRREAARLRKEIDSAKQPFKLKVGDKTPDDGRAIITSDSDAPALNHDLPSATAATRITIPDVPYPLIEACCNNGCVLFAGSGISSQAGWPTWSEFLAQLIATLEHDEGVECKTK
jgi:hypothetical protein